MKRIFQIMLLLEEKEKWNRDIKISGELIDMTFTKKQWIFFLLSTGGSCYDWSRDWNLSVRNNFTYPMHNHVYRWVYPVGCIRNFSAQENAMFVLSSCLSFILLVGDGVLPILRRIFRLKRYS